MSSLEQYRAKKIEELETWKLNMDNSAYKEIEKLLSQTIDELGKLPEKENDDVSCNVYAEGYQNGWNACIAEAERMRDLSIKGKR